MKIDKTKNIDFYSLYKPCNCTDCSNFCLQIKMACKDLSDYFAKYGIDIEKPWELIAVNHENRTEYVSCQYLIFGDCSDDFEMDLTMSN